jgi:hypothetical protein
MNSAINAFNKGNYSEAVGLLGESKPTEFENPVWHYYMANALWRLNQKRRIGSQQSERSIPLVAWSLH